MKTLAIHILYFDGTEQRFEVTGFGLIGLGLALKRDLWPVVMGRLLNIRELHVVRVK